MIHPNQEQEKSIEHKGGVLLRAGAGSGKTFILIKHIGFIILRFIEKNSSLENEKFRSSVEKYLDSIVLITFTRKAAGELLTRLRNDIEGRAVTDSLLQKKWKIVYECLDYLFIGTIHSFFQKIINQIDQASALGRKKLILDDELHILQNDLFKNFLAQFKEKDRVLTNIAINRSALLGALGEIFLNASFRLEWEKVGDYQLGTDSIEYVLEDIIKIKELSSIFDESSYDHEYLKKASELLKYPKNLSDLKAHKDFFDGYKRLPSKLKKYSDSIRERFDKLKEYRKFLKDNYDHFESYEKNKDGLLIDWFKWVKNIFDYLNKSYKEGPYMTYSDIEYRAFELLKNSNIRKRVSSRYKYIVIDEFQDTSEIQFDIISCIINNDFRKIFVVGDVKQAIYGFRGGELSVFEECKEKIPSILDLKNNYRSLPEIIKFNNDFFPKILKSPGHPQQFPGQEITDFGKVEIREITVEEEVDPKQYTSLESDGIIELLREDQEGDTAILYRRLAPSLDLIQKMINDEMSFSAQIKINKKEEPGLAIFNFLIRGYLLQEELTHTLFFVNKFFQLLSIKKNLVEEDLEDFYTLIETDGPYYAYLRFLYKHGISSSLSEINLSFIKTLLEICDDDLRLVYEKLKWFKNETFSFQLKIGSNPDRIKIMTIHSSKGLEFDRVILGGLHGSREGGRSREKFGRSFKSFCWKSGKDDKDFYKTPYFIFDQYEKKEKERLEQKRLFYVAMTRARKCLTWIDFHQDNKEIKKSSSSQEKWIDLLRSSGARKKKIDFLLKKEDLKEEAKASISHLDSLGILSDDSVDNKTLLLGELSVTKITTIVQCPRKFYLSNILKIPMNDFLPKSSSHASDPVSSTERGIEIHSAISKMINGSLQDTDSEILQWVQGEIKKYQGAQLISEKLIKFPLFGFMTIGVPDLVIIDNQKTLIWDFKTGSQGKNIEQHWMQLKLLAFAMWELKKVDKNNTIEISLLYVDQREKIDKIISFQNIKEEIYSLISLSNKISQINRSHCPHCSYGNLCRF